MRNHGDRTEEADDETTGDETTGTDDGVRVTKRGFLAGTSALLGSGLLGSQSVAAADDEHEDGPDASTATSGDGMVASSHPKATEIGVDVLEDGGNAVDAAVAVQFALNVVQPHTSGIGGGGFTIVYDAEADEEYAIDSRERAPLGATPDMFLDENGEEPDFQDLRTNGKAVGVPGTLRAADVMLKKFGSKERAELVDPAVHLAAEGVAVDAFLAESIAENVELDAFNEAAQAVFAPDGEPLEEGDDLVQPDLADTLDLIADEGSEAFYKGEIGADLAETVQGLARRRKRGGNMSTQDLGRYNIERTLPTVSTFEGDAETVTVRTMSLPTSGGLTIAQILQLLEPLDLAERDRRSVETYHLIAEASNLAFVDRTAHLGDDEFVDAPKQGFLDEDYVDQRRELIDVGSARESYEPGDPFSFQPGEEYRVDARDVEQFQNLANASGKSKESPHPAVEDSGQTTHFTTADAEGNVVSWTSTIEQLFGSGNMVPGRGFMLNNELTDFDAEPGGPNEVQPWKRPLSSTSPTIVFRDGEPFFSVGSPGGFTIITTVSQVILNVAEFGMSVEEAVEEPRVFAFGDGRLFVEETIPEETREGLADLGHEIEDSGQIGNAQAISKEGDTYVGVGDGRRDSSAQGS
ncbi:gamma-glutamyltransferase [Halomicrobium salinisoli]|uniref:gamma-glutamyltransferase n=1 Tax=Halomicrobium salinisoli TaxID=2878391 RepID=UPI001CF0B35E|nr:gamma-glutamyltransferase [Halomicrobium salinisoli]